MALKTQTFTTGDYAYQSWSNGYVITLTLTEKSASAVANTSQVSYRFTISNTNNNRFYQNGSNWDISIGGETIPIRDFSFDLSSNYTTQTIASGQLTVSHKADGTLNMPYNVSIPNIKAANRYGPPEMRISGQWPLTEIPRVSKISCPEGIIGQPVPISIESLSADFTYTVTYEIGELQGTVADRTRQNPIIWTIPTEFYTQTPSARKRLCFLTCQTFSGDTLVGTKSCQMYVHIDEADCYPTLSAQVEDSNPATIALTGDSNTLVRYCSNALVTAEYASKNSGIVRLYRVTHNGRNHRINPVTISRVENGQFDFEVTDSRKLTTSLSVTKSMIPYVKLTCDIASPEPDIEGNVRLSISGNYFAGSFGAASNQLTVQYRSKKGTDNWQEWQTIEHIVTENTFAAEVSLTALDYQKPYAFQARAIDRLDTVDSQKYTTRVLPVFDWGEEDFNFNVPVRFNGEVLSDFVIEQGVSGMWTYRKWSSGIAECWGRKDVSDPLSIKTSFGAFRLAAELPFDMTDIVFHISCGQEGRSTVYSGYHEVESPRIVYSYMSGFDYGAIWAFFDVKGRWK